jgi:hypothetical protein
VLILLVGQRDKCAEKSLEVIPHFATIITGLSTSNNPRRHFADLL